MLGPALNSDSEKNWMLREFKAHHRKAILIGLGVVLSISLAVIYMPLYPLPTQSLIRDSRFSRFFCIGNGCNSLDGHHHADSEPYSFLNDTWTTIYGLNQTANEIQNMDIQNFLYNAGVPPAPHLQNCPLLAKHIIDTERYDSKKGYPDWTLDSQGPKPPWIRGSDEDNLPLTRLVQRDIWIHQHPLNCQSSEVKFILTEWPDVDWHGIGSQFHVMAMMLGVSLTLNRVLVPFPKSFRRSLEPTCQGELQYSLDCYFVSLVSHECVIKAMEYYQSGNDLKQKYKDLENLTDILYTKEPLVYIQHDSWKLFLQLDKFPNRIVWPKFEVVSATKLIERHPRVAKKPWKDVNSFMELEQEEFNLYDTVKFRMWFLSQTVRYLLRWPSLHLCHVLNIERHNVYGRHVIDLIMEAKNFQSKADLDEELKRLGGFDAKGWHRSEPQFLRGLTDEPYLPRPIVSIHVRQGDKGSEMKLFSLEAHMYLANKLRYHEPNLKYAWLSTEMQDIVDETRAYPTWNIFYSDLPRQHGNEKMHDYEKIVGPSRFVDLSLANLMMASECDYFVGTLGSNWNLLINELRMTNGRVKSKYLSLNIFDLYFGR